MALLPILKTRLLELSRSPITNKLLFFIPVQFSFLVSLAVKLIDSDIVLEVPWLFLKNLPALVGDYFVLGSLIPCSARLVCMSSSTDSQQSLRSGCSALAWMPKPASSLCWFTSQTSFKSPTFQGVKVAVPDLQFSLPKCCCVYLMTNWSYFKKKCYVFSSQHSHCWMLNMFYVL